VGPIMTRDSHVNESNSATIMTLCVIVTKNVIIL
jgi:hypothetical protein